MKPVCSVNSCDRTAKVLGFCSAHYERLKRTQTLNPDKPLRKFTRDITDDQLREAAMQTNSWRGFLNCLGLATMSGARKSIQSRVRNLGIDVSHFPIQSPRVACLVDGCTKLSHAKGYCTRHYGFLKRNQDPTKRLVTGKKRYDAAGYIMLDLKEHPYVTSKSGRIFEHRFVMSHHLGRVLYPHEQVHHKNGRRNDNSLANLELWTRNQPTGGRVRDLITWAKEILTLYGDDETIY